MIVVCNQCGHLCKPSALIDDYAFETREGDITATVEKLKEVADE